MRIAYRNEIDNGTILSASTAISGYPETNLQDNRLSTTYRTATLTSATIKIDMGLYSDNVNTVALLNHNLTDNATITVAFSSSDFSAATTQTVTYNTSTMLKFFTNDSSFLTTEAGDFLTTEAGDYLITDHSYRYALVTITDTYNPDGYLEIGRLWIGSYLTLDPSSLNTFSISKQTSDNVFHGKGRQKFASRGITWRKFNLSFPRTQYTMIKEIEDMYDYVGNHTSVIFCNFDTDRSYQIVEPCYCSINGALDFTHVRSMQFEYSLELEEEK